MSTNKFPPDADVEDVEDVLHPGRTRRGVRASLTPNVLNVHNVLTSRVSTKRDPEVSDWGESEVAARPAEAKHALRLLARMLVAAARKGPTGGALGRPPDSQNQLDVSADEEVVSKRP